MNIAILAFRLIYLVMPFMGAITGAIETEESSPLLGLLQAFQGLELGLAVVMLVTIPRHQQRDLAWISAASILLACGTSVPPLALVIFAHPILYGFNACSLYLMVLNWFSHRRSTTATAATAVQTTRFERLLVGILAVALAGAFVCIMPRPYAVAVPVNRVGPIHFLH